MILLVSNPTDILSLEVLLRCSACGLGREDVIACDDKTLFDSASLALRMDRTGTEGSLTILDRRLAFDELEGVLYRPGRWWWPGEGFDIQDQMFVYHETMASWFAILSALPCRVVNRFGLSWWLQDLNYPRQLAVGLAEALDLPARISAPAGECAVGRIVPSGPPPSGSEWMYFAGRRVIPGAQCTEALVEHAEARGYAVDAWQEETGLSVVRADFTGGEHPALRYVEGFPLLEGEPPEVIAELGDAVIELLLEKRRAGV
jgi:hypothetical protein